jgi:predicted phosphodiesterase
MIASSASFSTMPARERPDPVGMARHDDRVTDQRQIAVNWTRRVALFLALVAVTLVGAGVALRLDGHVSQPVGPFTATFSVTPSIHGGTDVAIPPLGSLRVATHAGPARLNMQLTSIDQGRAEDFVHNPQGVAEASDTALPDVEDGVVRLAMQSAGVAIIGAMVLALAVFRRLKYVAYCGGLALAIVVGSGVIAVSTFRPGAIEEPTYKGLLSNAPSVIGDAHTIADRFDAYRTELQGLVTNVTRIYETMNTLPVYEPDTATIRVLHISDLHLNPSAWSVVSTVVKQFHIDLVIDTGDINDWGTTMESSFVNSIGALKVPYVFIRGNHDSAATARAVAKQSNAIVLENKITTVQGLTIAGIGDPRFTPDKTTVETPAPAGADHADDPVYMSGDRLAATIDASDKPVDVALVHDPASAPPLAGIVPLVLAGHLHHRETDEMPAAQGGRSTLMLVEGSTGGAGLRGLQGETPTPLEMSVLYFDADNHGLQAYDDITLGGTGQSQVTLERHVVKPESTPAVAPSSSG